MGSGRSRIFMKIACHFSGGGDGGPECVRNGRRFRGRSLARVFFVVDHLDAAERLVVGLAPAVQADFDPDMGVLGIGEKGFQQTQLQKGGLFLAFDFRPGRGRGAKPVQLVQFVDQFVDQVLDLPFGDDIDVEQAFPHDLPVEHEFKNRFRQDI